MTIWQFLISETLLYSANLTDENVAYPTHVVDTEKWLEFIDFVKLCSSSKHTNVTLNLFMLAVFIWAIDGNLKVDVTSFTVYIAFGELHIFK